MSSSRLFLVNVFRRVDCPFNIQSDSRYSFRVNDLPLLTINPKRIQKVFFACYFSIHLFHILSPTKRIESIFKQLFAVPLSMDETLRSSMLVYTEIANWWQMSLHLISIDCLLYH